MADTTSWAGRFVWHELRTTDVARSLAFYGGLLGWDLVEQATDAGTHRTLKIGDRMLGSVEAVDADTATQTGWTPYLTVDDTAAAVATATGLAATVLKPAWSLDPVGDFAQIADPGGAPLYLFRSQTPGASNTTPLPGAFHQHQLLTGDVAAANAFYAALVGWSAQSFPGSSPGAAYHRGDDLVAAALQMPGGADEPAHWLCYVAVIDVDATHGAAVGQGAMSLWPPSTYPGFGRFCVMADPLGVKFGLWQLG